MVTLWLLTIVVLRFAFKPYDVLLPYSTWESEGSLVVQVILAELLVIFVTLMLLIVGGVVSDGATGVLMETCGDCSEAFPDTSYAETVYI